MSSLARVLAVLLVACVAGPTAPISAQIVYPGGDGPGAGKHVVLVAGDEEYRSEEALPMLGKILSEHHGFRCTVLFSLGEDGVINPDNQRNIPGLAALDDADFLVLFTRFRRLPDEEMKHIVDYVESGKPLLGIRTATHAFAYGAEDESPYKHWSWNAGADWNDADWPQGFGRQVLGETWVNHHGHHKVESTRGVVPEDVADHPILHGVADVWGPTDVYGIRDLPEDAVVLLEGAVLTGMSPDDGPVDGEKNDPRMPITWLRHRPLPDGGTQRVVASTIGAAIDLASEDLRRLFVNAVYWGLEMPVPERAVADPVGAYEPTMYGFGGFVQGVRPEEHALR